MARPADRRRAPRVRRRTGALVAAALGLWLGSVEHAFAQPNQEAVTDPAADRVWAGCKLDLNTVNAIITSLNQGDIDIPNFSFGVVYALAKPNHGQPLTTQSGGGFTGPVVCISNQGIAIEKTNEEENIPTSEDQGAGITSVDLRDLSQALVARYSYPPAPPPPPLMPTLENRFCHTVSNPADEPLVRPPESNMDCFRVFAGTGSSEPALPRANQVWANCTLDSITAIPGLRSAIQAGRDIDDPNVEISYLVVYSNNNANHGQPLTTQSGGGFTGPVICKAPDVGTATTSESADTSAMDLLDTSEALVLRYGFPTGATAQRPESRFCHTVASSGTGGPPETNTDCFRVFPTQ